MSTDGFFSCLKPKTSQDEADFSYQPSEYNNNPESEICVVPCTELFQGNDIYQISNGSFRGKAMIVNFKKFQNSKEYPTRNGSERDAQNLQSLFTQIGFQIFGGKPLVDLDSWTFKTELSKFANDKDHGDIMILVVMSHGDAGIGGGVIFTVDGEKFDIEKDIISWFNNRNPNLKGKPKLFIFQSCLGDRKPLGIITDARPISSPPPGAPPGSPLSPSMMSEQTDMLIAHSTVPGCVSLRNPENGSWFIQDLCEVFMENSHNTHVEKMLKRVGELVMTRDCQGVMQTPEYKLSPPRNRSMYKVYRIIRVKVVGGYDEEENVNTCSYLLCAVEVLGCPEPFGSYIYFHSEDEKFVLLLDQ